MIGKKLFWNGDFSNPGRTGIVADEANGSLVIRWGDGSEMLVPTFVIARGIGWRVL